MIEIVGLVFIFLFRLLQRNHRRNLWNFSGNMLVPQGPTSVLVDKGVTLVVIKVFKINGFILIFCRSCLKFQVRLCCIDGGFRLKIQFFWVKLSTILEKIESFICK